MKQRLTIIALLSFLLLLVACGDDSNIEATEINTDNAEQNSDELTDEENSDEETASTEEESSTPEENTDATSEEADNLLIEEYKAEGQKLLRRFNDLYIADTEEEFEQSLIDVFYMHEDPHQALLESGFFMPGAYSSIDVTFEEENITVSEITEGAFTYTSVQNLTAFNADGETEEVSENVMIYVENVDGVYLIISMDSF